MSGSNNASLWGAISSAGVIFGIFISLKGWLHQRLTIETKLRKSDIESFEKLYSRRIPEDDRESIDKIVGWLKESKEYDKSSPYKDKILLAKFKSRICGFIYVTYYYSPRYLFVSYLVKDDEDSEVSHKNVTGKLLDKLHHMLKKEFKGCRAIIAEIDPINSNKKRSRKSAKLELFRGFAKTFGYNIQELIGVPYRQPDLSSRTNQVSGKKMLLLYIGVSKNEWQSNRVSKDEIKNVLKFIYCDIYGDSYGENTEIRNQNKTYFEGFFNRVWAEYADLQIDLEPRPGVREGLMT
ncbi:MAG: hypothetical protein PHW12_00315 [Smithella sp.]|nr:hypothetical protein [Smithella sp.]